MKILFLNPHVDAQHKMVRALEARDMAILVPADAEEAWKILQLHAKSVNLAIIHREGMKDEEAGLKLIAKIKADPAQADLPVVVTSSVWNDKNFVIHQNTPQGANAYIRWPCEEKQLVDLVGSLFGLSFSGTTTDSRSFAAPETQVVQTPSAAQEVPSGFSTPALQPMHPPPVSDKQGSSGPKSEQEFVLEEVSSVFANPLASSGSSPGSDFALEAPVFEDTASVRKPDAAPLVQEPTVPGEGSNLLLPPDTSQVTASIIHSPPEPPRESTELRTLLDKPVQSDSLPLATPAEMAAILETPAQADAPLSAPPPPPEGGSLSSIDLSALVLQADGVQEHQGPSIPELSGAASNLRPPAPPQPETAARPPAPPAPELQDVPEVQEQDLAAEMPYLFTDKGGAAKDKESRSERTIIFAQPVGDSVVPGGAAQSPDNETLKKYLLLREQDVAALSRQLNTAQEQVAALESTLKGERGKVTELERQNSDQARKIEEFEKEKALAIEGLQSELSEVRFQIKAKSDKARILETQVKDAAENIERIKERVRQDIRKIRIREKELENRLEIMKKDSEALISARENKIIELKRKIDLLEFNMDLLQDQFSREKEASSNLRERLAKAAQVVRVAGGLLDTKGAAAAEGAAPADGSTDESNVGASKAS